MKFFSSNRYAAIGAAGALAVGTVLTAGALSPAAGAEKTANYDCLIAGGPATLPITTVMQLPSEVPAGQEVPGIPVEMGVPLPGGILDLARALGATALSGTMDNAAFSVGSLPVGAPGLAAPATDIPDAGGMVLSVVGATQSFTAPSAGTYPVKLPESFEFLAYGTPVPVPIPCTLADGASAVVGQLSVVGSGGEPQPAEKEDSTTVAKIKNAPVTVGERGRLRIRVTDENGVAEGKVVVRLDGERLTRKTLNDNGRTGVRLPKLNRGKHVVVVKYLGNAETERSRDRVPFRVRRG